MKLVLPSERPQMNRFESIKKIRLILGTDHRLDFAREVVGSGREPTAAENISASALKNTVLDGLKAAVDQGVPISSLLLWSDGDLGESSLLRAKSLGFPTAVSVSDSHLQAWDKMTKFDSLAFAFRVAYDPDDEILPKARIQSNLKRLSRQCTRNGIPVILELTHKPTAAQLSRYGKEEALSVVSIRAAQQMMDGEIEPALWVIPTPNSQKAADVLASFPFMDDRRGSATIFSIAPDPRPLDLQDQDMVNEEDAAAIKMTAAAEGAAGVLMGPGIYWDLLIRVCKGDLTDSAASFQIGKRIAGLWEAGIGKIEPLLPNFETSFRNV